MPIEAYRGSEEATKLLFRICRIVWNTERIPANLVRGMFVMIYKKGSRDDYRNYRAICQMILLDGRQAVITFIDYSAACNSESQQLFLGEALAEA